MNFDEDLLKRFGTILHAINSSNDVDAEKFRKFAEETARIVVQKYSFWTMSPTVHKVLLHGKEIILHNILPVGLLSFGI